MEDLVWPPPVGEIGKIATEEIAGDIAGQRSILYSPKAVRSGTYRVVEERDKEARDVDTLRDKALNALLSSFSPDRALEPMAPRQVKTPLSFVAMITVHALVLVINAYVDQASSWRACSFSPSASLNIWEVPVISVDSALKRE